MNKNYRERLVILPILLTLSFLFLLFKDGRALEMPPRPLGRVSDYASVLSPAAKARLETQLQQFEKDTSNQIVVAIFPSIEEESVDDFTNRLFEKWKLGQKDRNNGILLAVFMKEKKVRIEVGYGLEGVLTDATSSRIIRDELAPEFRAGRPDVGIEKAVNAMEKATRGEYKGKQAEPNPWAGWGSTIFFFVVLLIIFYVISQSQKDIYWSGPRRGRRGRGNDWWGGSSGGGFSGGGFGGGSSGGGGFSGGGGMSGGGGASGGW
jgi:uncharacterized protein